MERLEFENTMADMCDGRQYPPVFLYDINILRFDEETC